MEEQSVTSPSGLRDSVIRAWNAVLGQDLTLEPDGDFFSCGGNSLTALRLIAALEEEHGTEIDVRVVAIDPTIEGIVTALRASLPARVATLPRTVPQARVHVPSVTASITSALVDWQPEDRVQSALRADFLQLATTDVHAHLRQRRPAHFTTSTFVVDAAFSKTLLVHHRKLDIWVQPGGHCEEGDVSIHASALRELHEEVGIETVTLGPRPLELDRHVVPCAGETAEHWDIRWLAVVEDDVPVVVSDESSAIQWWPLNALPDRPELRRLAERLPPSGQR